MKNKIYSPRLSASLIVSLITIFTLPIFAQTWLAEGQTWQYDVKAGWNIDLYGLYAMSVNGDTTIQGIICKKVLFDNLYLPTQYFAYESGGQVYLWKGNGFLKIYDFNLGIGDSIILNQTRKYKILSKGTIEIAGSILQTQEIGFISNNGIGISRLIIEGIGLAGTPNQNDGSKCSFFFLNYSHCDGVFDGWDFSFRCFTDGEFYYHPNGECTLSDTSPPLENQVHFTISPNPAHQSLLLKIDGQMGLAKLELFNTTGQIVHHRTTVDLDDPLEISVADFPNGLYFVRLTNEHGSISKPVVVNH